MSGPTPITANFRLTFKYTVAGLQHRQQNYLDCVTSADPSGYDAVGRPGGPGNHGVAGIEQNFFTPLQAFYDPSSASFDTWELFIRVGTVFSFVSSGPATIAPTASGPVSNAVGWCIAGKDIDNRNLPAYIYEGNFRTTAKENSYAALNAAEQAVVDYFYAIGRAAVSKDAWNWRTSRGGVHENRYLASVWDSNEKLRRIRHIK